MIPQAAMSMRGHVVITFFVHKDGRITDVTVAKPSDVDAFTLSAQNAILTSNPTYRCRPSIPTDKAFFTVTFYFNEQPPVTMIAGRRGRSRSASDPSARVLVLVGSLGAV